MCTKRKLATKETLDNIRNSINLNIPVLYESIFVLKVLDVVDNEDITIAKDLLMGISYIYLDTNISIKANFDSKTGYEKRFHLKNLLSAISEGYKYLHHFDRASKKSFWARLRSIVESAENDELLNRYEKLSVELKEFGKNFIDKDMRDITFHYDSNIVKVYEKTISIHDEDAEFKLFANILESLKNVHLFTKDLLDSLVVKVTKTSEELAIPELDINTTFPNTQFRNEYITNLEKIHMLRDFIIEEPKIIDENIRRIKIHEAANKYFPRANFDTTRYELKMILAFMKADIAAIVIAYIKSDTEIEMQFHIRRLIIARTSTLSHIYGYDDEEKEKSLFKRLQSRVEKRFPELITELAEIGDMLKKETEGTSDKDTRASYIHLGEKKKNYIPQLI